MDDIIFDVLEMWPQESLTPNIVVIEKSVAQKKKEETKLCMV